MIEFFVEQLPRLSTTSIQINISKENINNVEINTNEEVQINNEIIQLPSPIPGSSRYTINSVNETTSIIRFRDSKEFLTSETAFGLQDNYKWNIKIINKLNGSFLCKNCETEIIEISKIKKLLPMPSELWYEMIDFWHCHKPIEGSNNNNTSLLKKFNELKPNNQNVIIGSYYFLINPEDWNLNVIDNIIKCKCGYDLGERDLTFMNFKIFKWRLKIGNEFFRPYQFITLKLLEEMNYGAVRVFTLRDNERKIKVWCFGTGINILLNKKIFSNCLKIMYKDTIDEEHLIDIEYEEPFNDFLKTITEINELMPDNLKKFKDWNVGYIPE
jgi:hypothetical protein